MSEQIHLCTICKDGGNCRSMMRHAGKYWQPEKHSKYLAECGGINE